jgi:hypothetical protein
VDETAVLAATGDPVYLQGKSTEKKGLDKQRSFRLAYLDEYP